MVFDRLSVLVIRICVHRGRPRARERRRPRPLRGARLPVLHEQLALLQAALEALFDDVRTGRKRFVPYQSLKLYGADPNRVKAISAAIEAVEDLIAHGRGMRDAERRVGDRRCSW